MKRDEDEYEGIDAELEVPVVSKGGISLRTLKTFDSLKNPVYRLYFTGMLGHMASLNMQMIARSFLIYQLTGSATLLGLLALATALPMLFLALFGGVIADRVQKKYVVIAGQATSAVVSLAIALSLTTGYLSAEHAGSWWVLMVASVLQGTIMSLMLPSRQALIREIVTEEQLMNAVALNSLGMNMFRLMAPAITGFLIDAAGFEAVYYAMTGMYLYAVIVVSFMPRTSKITITGGGALKDISEGFRYIRQNTTILYILVFVLFVVVLSMPYIALLPIFTVDILKVSATGMGVLISVSGIGALVGSITLASLPSRKRGIMLLISSLILGLALVAFSFSSTWNFSLAVIIFVGLGQAGRMTLSNTLLQHYSDDEYRGRVMSFYMMERGLTSFGTFGAAMIAEAVGVQWAVGGFASVLVLIALLALIFVPRLRKLE